MELIVSLLLGDDGKKGKIILKSKCKQLQLKADDKDDAPDGGSKGRKSLGKYKGGDIVYSSGTSMSTTQRRSESGKSSGVGRKKSTTVIKELTVTITQTLTVTNADKNQSILEIEVGAEARGIRERKKVGESSKLALEDIKSDSDISTPDKAHVEDTLIKADEVARLTSDTAQVKETEIQPFTTADTVRSKRYIQRRGECAGRLYAEKTKTRRQGGNYHPHAEEGRREPLA
ncbi:hypothetical protein AgCh_016775 [Apium graveolens]